MKLKNLKKIPLALLAVTLVVLISSATVSASPMVLDLFFGGPGGQTSYDNTVLNALQGSSIPLFGIQNDVAGSTLQPISGATLNFTSGGFSAGSQWTFGPGTFSIDTAGGSLFSGTLQSVSVQNLGGSFLFENFVFTGTFSNAMISQYGLSSNPYQGSMTLTFLASINGSTFSNVGYSSPGGFANAHAVPEPASVILLGSGLLGLVGLRLRGPSRKLGIM